MAKNKYAYNNKDADESKTARAMARSLKVSPKHCVEICSAIRGMDVAKAKAYLNDVIEMKKAVPFKRHNRDVGHRKGMKGWAAGRYPVKASKAILNVIENLSKESGYTKVYIDFLLWHYCSVGFGNICSENKSKCEKCVIKEFCNNGDKYGQN